MLLLIRILISVYILAINIYSFLLLRYQRDAFDDGRCNEESIGDGKLIITAMLGGATGIYTGMFVMKYRLKSLLLMVGMPVLIVINVYAVIVAYTGGFFITATESSAMLFQVYMH